MRRILVSACLALVGALLLLPSPARAWGQAGHYTVCEIAYLNLTPAAKAEVDRLVALSGTFASFTETCTFPDNPPARRQEHFANFRRDVGHIRSAACPDNSPCVISAIQQDLAVLRSNASDQDKATAILFIGHWFGDIHQPLHISFADDRGGNEINVLGACRFSLHSVWDTCIVETRILGAGTDRLQRSRAAAAALNARISAAQRRAWLGGGPGDWAAESLQITLDPATGYCVQKGSSCWYSDSQETYADGGPKRIAEIDQAYLDRNTPVVAERLQRAGLRLAQALNETFDPGHSGLSAVPAVTAATSPLPSLPTTATSASPTAGTYIVHVLDVGTGLAIFVEGPDFTLLYDAGSNDDTALGDRNRVLAYIRAVRPDLRRIDHIILSHPHRDHVELMPDLLDAFEVANVWDSGAFNAICGYRRLLEKTAQEEGVVYHYAQGAVGPRAVKFPSQTCYKETLPAATITIPHGVPISDAPVRLGADASMTILHADRMQTSNFNEASVVVRLDLGKVRLLLPGDAEAGGRSSPTDPPARTSVEGQLLATRAQDLRADILVAPHHGSKTSSRTAFLDAVGARIFVVSAGPTSYSGIVLPDSEVLKQYDKRGTIWRTDVNDTACAANPAKIGPDADGKPGGCDNIIISITASGTISVDNDRRSD